MSENLNMPPAEINRWQKRRAELQRVWLFPVGIVTGLLTVSLYSYLFPAPSPLTTEEVHDSIMQAMDSATPAPANSTLVYETILPSLVLIQTQSDAASTEEGFAVGSGVVVNQNSDILTTLHVVADAANIEVMFADGTQATAEIISTKPESDIAVLHPEKPPGLIVPAVLGSLNGMRVGDEAFAVGNPLGLPGSMSAGIISGFNRSIAMENSEKKLEGLIQFDAAVNPGNSGGPLLNRNGQVIGIITALANPSEQNFFVGIGFAIPIGTASSVAGGPPQ